MGSVSYGLGADLSLPPCLTMTIGIWTLAHRSDTRAEISGEVVRYNALAPRPPRPVFCLHIRRSPLTLVHIRGNDMNCDSCIVDIENRRFYLLFLRLIWDFARDWLQQMLYLVLMHFIVDLAQKRFSSSCSAESEAMKYSENSGKPEGEFELNRGKSVFGIFLPKKAVLAETNWTMVRFYSHKDLSMSKMKAKSIFRLVPLIGDFGRFL